MRLLRISFILLLLVSNTSTQASEASCPTALNHTVQTLVDNKPVNLCKDYAGQVVLIVNTASKCAFTYQYEGLEAMYERYKSQGFVVLGFPSNDFASQEPGTEKKIRNFCRMTYGVQFPMFSKSRVVKGNPDPLYATLGKLSGEFPRWNFHKYLINRQGDLVGSYQSHVKPTDKQLVGKIEELLDQHKRGQSTVSSENIMEQ